MKRENYYSRVLKGRLKETSLGKKLQAKVRKSRDKLFPKSEYIDTLFPDVKRLLVNFEAKSKPVIGIHKGVTEFDGYYSLTAPFFRYKRFLDNNNIEYKEINLFQSDWLEQCKDVDIVVTTYNSEPSRLREQEGKVFILENFHNKVCYPSAKDLWSYEDKVRLNYLIKEYGIPHVKTFISNDYNESMQFVDNAVYPLVSKVRTGSGSRGVELVRTKREACKIVKQNFSITGRKALWTYTFEKDYVYFQEFIKDATYDLRVFSVGDIVLGYRRVMRGKDFRASGTGTFIRESLPETAINLALKLKNKWNTTMLATDFVDTNNSQDHLVIEASISYGIDYPEYVEIEGKKYYYLKTCEGIELKEGSLWTQEFILLELINQWLSKEGGDESPIRLKWQLR